MPRRALAPSVVGMGESPPPSPLRVVIAGAGVAGLETLVALRALAGPRVQLTLVAPVPEFVYRPLAVAEPFGVAHVQRYPLDRIAGDLRATFVQDELSWVGSRRQCVFLGGGDELGYDALVVALGAVARAPWQGVPTFGGPADIEMVRGLVDEVVLGLVSSLAFVVPTGVTWPFPLYELALQTARRAADAGAQIDIAFFSPEPEPLAVFGPEASAEVAAIMAAAGVRFQGGAAVEVDGSGNVLLPGAEGLRFERLVTLPRPSGGGPAA